MAYSKAQNEANKRYMEKARKEDPQKINGNSYLSKARTYVNKYATLEGLEELKTLIEEKEKELRA